MTLRAIINGKSVGISSFSMDLRQRQVGTFDLVVPTRDILDIGNTDLYQLDISVVSNEFEIISGLIKTSLAIPDFQNENSHPLLTKLKCDDNFGRLVCVESQLFHFQDTLGSVAIATLLASSGTNWVLNDTSTLSDIQITLDLRSKENIYSQIQEIVQNMRTPTFLRYGGFDGTNHLLDIGSFDRKINSQYAILGNNIISAPQFSAQTTEPLKRLFPVSGESIDLPVSLSDALNIDPTLSSPTQDFQIVGESIVNNTRTTGCSLRRSYSVIKTENDTTPTQTDLNQAALALYRKGVRDIEESEPYYSLTVQVSVDSEPLMHEKFYFEGSVYESIKDDLTGQIDFIKTFELETWLKLVGVKATFNERYETKSEIGVEIPKLLYELELTSKQEADVFDEFEIINKKLETNTKFDDNVGAGATTIGVLGTATVTVNNFNSASDCVLSSGTLGKTFIFTAPTAPTGSTNAIVTITSINATLEVNLVQLGNVGTDHILCVSGSGASNWTIVDNETISVTWLFTNA
jgi:hypothetical protein